jgi:carotenoid cleavage dioxygenase-like enzyme
MALPFPLEGLPPLPMEGALPPDLVGTLFRVGPAASGVVSAGSGGADGSGAASDPGAGTGSGSGSGSGSDDRTFAGSLHAIELRDGTAVSYVSRPSPADAGVFWHAGSLLALPEAGVPLRYDRFLRPAEFRGDLRLPIASHVHRVAADGSRILFSVDDGSWDSGASEEGEGDGDGGGRRDTGGIVPDADVFLRIGEWNAAGDLRTAQSVALERATWQHDVGVTEAHVVFIESPTRRLRSASRSSPVPYGWLPGAESWIGVVERGGDGSVVQWFSVPLCLVTHVMGAWEDKGTDAGIELFVCCYAAPETGQPIDLSSSVLGPEGIGLSPIGEGLAVLERWSIRGDRLERTTLDDRNVEYPRIDAVLDGAAFRYGYCIETSLNASGETGGGAGITGPVQSLGLLRFDLVRDEVTSWRPGAGCVPSEPVFVRATDGRADDEGWLLTVVDDADRGASDIYVLDASDFGRRRPEAVIHLPVRLPFRSHGEWVPADRYR